MTFPPHRGRHRAADDPGDRLGAQGHAGDDTPHATPAEDIDSSAIAIGGDDAAMAAGASIAAGMAVGGDTADVTHADAALATVLADEDLPTNRTSGVVRASSMMAIATLVSRVTGFISKVVILAFLGAWVVNDAYNLANILPNIIFELLIGGVLTSVAIPLLSRARHDADGGAGYTNGLMTLAIVTLAVATVAAVAGAPWLIRMYLWWGESNADPVLATQLAYLLLPQIFFYGLAALFGAILNTKERFAAPVWAPVINNLVVITIGIMLLRTVGGLTDPAHGMVDLSQEQFLLLGLGTTAGIILQAVVMVPSLLRSGFRFRFRWQLDDRMKEAGHLMGWAIGYAAISQVGYIVITWTTTGSRGGLLTLFNYGSMLFQLPYGILGVSLLTAIMPRMSRHAGDGKMDAVRHDMTLANRLSSVGLLPVTAAMIALAPALATITARYGKMADEDVHILAWTLVAFAIGLLPLALTLVQMRVFYAMKDARTPTIINALMVGVRVPLLLLCLLLPSQWVVPGLAAAMSFSYVVGFVIGQWWLHVRFGSMQLGATMSAIGRVGTVSVVAGVGAWYVTAHVLHFDSTSLNGAIGMLLVGGVMGLIVVVVGMMLLRVDEVMVLRRRLLGARHRRLHDVEQVTDEETQR